MSRKITKFRCNDCDEVFDRDDTIEKLDEFRDPQGNIKYTNVLGCPNCPSRKISIEEMGE